MALEFRTSNIYYYRKKRVGNREYLGKGEMALLFSNFDKMEREEQQLKTEQIRKIKAKNTKIDLELSNLEKHIKSLVENVLIEKGFYKTKSREWRYKNGRK